MNRHIRYSLIRAHISNFSCIRKTFIMKDRELAQSIRAIADLSEDLGIIPSTHKVPHNTLLLQFLEILLWPPDTMHTCDSQTYNQVKNSYT